LELKVSLLSPFLSPLILNDPIGHCLLSLSVSYNQNGMIDLSAAHSRVHDSSTQKLQQFSIDSGCDRSLLVQFSLNGFLILSDLEVRLDFDHSFGLISRTSVLSGLVATISVSGLQFVLLQVLVSFSHQSSLAAFVESVTIY